MEVEAPAPSLTPQPFAPWEEIPTRLEAGPEDMEVDSQNIDLVHEVDVGTLPVHSRKRKSCDDKVRVSTKVDAELSQMFKT